MAKATPQAINVYVLTAAVTAASGILPVGTRLSLGDQGFDDQASLDGLVDRGLAYIEGVTKLPQTLEEASNAIAGLSGTLTDTQKERDQLKAKADELQKQLDAVSPEELAKVTEERDKALTDLAEVTKERDELKVKVEELEEAATKPAEKPADQP